MYEWEEAVRRRNYDETGVDFVRAARMFANPVLEREDSRRFSGERRFIALGHDEGFFMVVVTTPRGARRRIVEAWRADSADEAIYRAAVPQTASPDGGPHGRLRALKADPWRDLLAGSRPRLSFQKPKAHADKD